MKIYKRSGINGIPRKGVLQISLHGTIGNAKCGDIMKMYLKIEDGIIKDAKFKTFGCGAAVATSSIQSLLKLKQ